MDLPDGETTIRDWALNNTAIAVHLENFARSRLDRLRTYDGNRNAVLKLRGPVPEDPEAPGAKRRYYEAMLKSLQLALQVHPSSESIRTDMAKAEEFLGHYESAHQHLTEVINAIRARNGPAEPEQLIRVTTQRARVALHWANDLREGGVPEQRLRALGMLQESTSSLASCQGIARAKFSEPIIQPGSSERCVPVSLAQRGNMARPGRDRAGAAKVGVGLECLLRG